MDWIGLLKGLTGVLVFVGLGVAVWAHIIGPKHQQKWDEWEAMSNRCRKGKR